MKEILIRKGTENDAEDIAQIIIELDWWEKHKQGNKQALVRQVQENTKLSEADAAHSLYVAEYNEKVVGYANVHWLPYMFMDGLEGFIGELFILADMRGKGIGSRLLSVIKDEARKKKCSRLMLINSRTRESYKREFYLKDGFSEREQAANFVMTLD